MVLVLDVGFSSGFSGKANLLNTPNYTFDKEPVHASFVNPYFVVMHYKFTQSLPVVTKLTRQNLNTFIYLNKLH